MSKGPTQLPPNPFSRSETFGVPSQRSAFGGFSDGVKVDTPSTKVTREEMVEPPKVNDPNAKAAAEKAKTVSADPRSAVSGFDQGSPASTRKIDTADFPAGKANPFDRKPKPASLRPEATQVSPIKPTSGFGSEAGNTKRPDGPEIVTTSKGLEVAQVKAQNPDEFAQRIKQAQNPVTADDIKEVTADNYTKVYELKEKEKTEIKQVEIKQAQEIKRAEEASKQSNDSAMRAAQEAQVQMAKNAALAHQARELQGKMANLRGQLGQGGDDAATWAAIDECRVALAQIPTGLQG